jgi:hypothetical protein
MSIRMWVGVESLRTIEPELKTVRKGSLEFIYFIQGGPKHPIKIGKTRDLLGRLSTIQCSYPVGLLDTSACSWRRHGRSVGFTLDSLR